MPPSESRAVSELSAPGKLAPRESDAVTPLERLYEAAARDFISSGTMTEGGDAVVRPRGSPTAQRLGPLLVDVDGVNVHADLRIEANDREGRERLLRYGLRPPFAYEQLEETTDGRIAFALRKRRKNGDTHRFFTPMQFLRRLAWLIVPPRQALVRYEGVLAPAAKWRALVVPPPPAVSLAQNLAPPLQLADPALPARAADPTKTTPTRAAAMRWAALLRRV